MKSTIAFSYDMVLAGRAGLKTQTRRVIGNLRTITDWSQDAEPGEIVMYRGWPHKLEESRGRNKRASGELTPRKISCPYGVPGHILAVQEAYQIFKSRRKIFVRYLADGEERPINLTSVEIEMWNTRKNQFAPTPGRFMYASLARNQIIVKSIRVERVQEISEEDAKAEGVKQFSMVRNELSRNAILKYSYKKEFKILWYSINGKRYPWESNPLVWVIEHEWREVNGT